VYGLDADRTLVYFNPAYAAFCAANGGDLELCGLGVSLPSAIEEPFLRVFYDAAYGRIFDGGEAWRSQYLCPSVTESRVFDMVVEPLRDANGRVAGVLVWNRLREAHAAPAEAHPRADLEESGTVMMCAVCRRVHDRRADRWLWIPRYLELKSTVSHGLCDSCGEAYYGER